MTARTVSRPLLTLALVFLCLVSFAPSSARAGGAVAGNGQYAQAFMQADTEAWALSMVGNHRYRCLLGLTATYLAFWDLRQKMFSKPVEQITLQEAGGLYALAAYLLADYACGCQMVGKLSGPMRQKIEKIVEEHRNAIFLFGDPAEVIGEIEACIGLHGDEAYRVGEQAGKAYLLISAR
ncbi:MAG: hypothetical protein Q4F72_04520 [Desulfovibrionaceae bacterium]|nr:hypothetical protein [Desulfovibrionaceae bacterium]